MRKKAFNFISIVILIVFISFTTSCEGESSGFFKYKIWEDNTVSIMGLTKEGKKQETIVIPTTIDGHKVKSFGYTQEKWLVFPIVKGDELVLDLESDRLKTVYFNSQVDCVHAVNPFYITPNIYKIFWPFPSFFNSGYFYQNQTELININGYVSNILYINDRQNEPEWKKIYSCNLTYIFNYSKEENADENNLDKVFFVDYVEDTIVNVIPPDPIREGYEFKGWYKEEDCINKWDFENDIVPKAIYDSNGIILNETSLYASWEEI